MHITYMYIAMTDKITIYVPPSFWSEIEPMLEEAYAHLNSLSARVVSVLAEWKERREGEK